jgi:hypothetical protein
MVRDMLARGASIANSCLDLRHQRGVWRVTRGRAAQRASQIRVVRAGRCGAVQAPPGCDQHRALEDSSACGVD